MVFNSSKHGSHGPDAPEPAPKANAEAALRVTLAPMLTLELGPSAEGPNGRQLDATGFKGIHMDYPPVSVLTTPTKVELPGGLSTVSDSTTSSVESPTEPFRAKPTQRLSADEKKRRNRDCMRRLRQRRVLLVSDMREEIQRLEDQLNAEVDAAERRKNDPSDAKRTIRQLREENYWLQKQLALHKDSTSLIGTITHERLASSEPLDAAMIEEEEISAWINNLEHFFAPIPEEQARATVLASYQCIRENMAIARQYSVNSNPVLGWTDQRWLEGNWASFLLSKKFPHENTRELVWKTWELVSNFERISVLQPKARHMKVLQRLGDHTLVIARNSYSSVTKKGFCSIYLLFLLETDDGFVIGTRSLEPDWERMKLFLSKRLTYGRMFYCYHFKDLGENGCALTFGGRTDGALREFAEYCIMDMLLAILRWENHCVAPLFRLAT